MSSATVNRATLRRYKRDHEDHHRPRGHRPADL